MTCQRSVLAKSAKVSFTLWWLQSFGAGWHKHAQLQGAAAGVRSAALNRAALLKGRRTVAYLGAAW